MTPRRNREKTMTATAASLPLCANLVPVFDGCETAHIDTVRQHGTTIQVEVEDYGFPKQYAIGVKYGDPEDEGLDCVLLEEALTHAHNLQEEVTEELRSEPGATRRERREAVPVVVYRRTPWTVVTITYRDGVEVEREVSHHGDDVAVAEVDEHQWPIRY